MEPNRAFWNQQQQELRQILGDSRHPERAKALFLSQHAMVHRAEMAQSGEWSFADEVLAGLSDADWRTIPPKEEHSIAWNIWHIARIEDMTMNRLVAGQAQLFHEQGWQNHLKIEAVHSGNAMSLEEVAALSRAIDIDALQEYRLAVGKRTRLVVSRLQGTDFKQKVAPDRLEKIWADGGLPPNAQEIADYWGGLTIAGLLLMPPTPHCFVHLNEMLKMKQNLRKSHK